MALDKGGTSLSSPVAASKSAPSLVASIAAGLDLLSSRERKWAVVLAVGLLIAGAVELVSMTTVLPFIALVVSPTASMPTIVSGIYTQLGSPNRQSFVLWLGIAIVILISLSTMLNWTVLWAQNHYAAWCQNRLAREVFERCVEAPYSWFLTQNSTTLMRMVYEDVRSWSSGLIQRLIGMVTDIITVVVALALLFTFSRKTALVAIAVVCVITVLAFYLTRPVISSITRVKHQAKDDTAIAANHALTGIKDVKLSSREGYFVRAFDSPYRVASKADAALSVWQSSPAMVMVLLGQVALVGIALVLYRIGIDNAQIASQLALLLIVTAKVLPAMSSLNSAFNNLWNSFPYVEGVRQLLMSIERETLRVRQDSRDSKASIDRWESIDLHGVSFQFPASETWAILGLSTTIRRGGTYGIVGRSGAGKSTLVDLVVGLLQPTEGTISVDGRALRDLDISTWQRRIGYVPQAPFIAHESLRANVAFGLGREAVDDDRVIECLRMANLGTLLEELGHDLDVPLGDRGQRLSGGQRQRVAIARALYKQPEILVLDEATSALDSISEREILETIDTLSHQLTLLIIAHRISTIQHCDQLLLLEGGRLVGQGTFGELQSAHSLFRDLSREVASVA
jgi:ABC-type multidrug transport system fused ATPase/permease subunit